jgi:hypothetical protein
VPNTTGYLPGPRPAPGIDLRGDGGYVVVAPSSHISGGSYRWPEVVPIAALPGWLCPAPRRAGQQEPAAAVTRRERYVAAALEREAQRVRDAVAGQRNNALNLAAFAPGTLVGGGALDDGTARQALLLSAVEVGLAQREAERTISSGLRAGVARPRRLPAPVRGLGRDRRREHHRWHAIA